MDEEEVTQLGQMQMKKRAKDLAGTTTRQKPADPTMDQATFSGYGSNTMSDAQKAKNAKKLADLLRSQ